MILIAGCGTPDERPYLEPLELVTGTCEGEPKSRVWERYADMVGEVSWRVDVEWTSTKPPFVSRADFMFQRFVADVLVETDTDYMPENLDLWVILTLNAEGVDDVVRFEITCPEAQSLQYEATWGGIH